MTPYSSDCNENRIYITITFIAEKKKRVKLLNSSLQETLHGRIYF